MLSNETLTNPYLDLFEESTSTGQKIIFSNMWGFLGPHMPDPQTGKDIEFVFFCRRRFAYAIPNKAAISTITRYGKRIIEIGAGSGYWAWLLDQAGIDVVAYDNDEWGTDEQISDSSFWRERWFDVKSGDHKKVSRHSDRDCLFLCWPIENVDADCEAPDIGSLLRFKGRYVAYVGEWKYGCTGTNEFRRAIDHDWTKVERCPIPRWPGMNDRLTIYERNLTS